MQKSWLFIAIAALFLTTSFLLWQILNFSSQLRAKNSEIDQLKQVVSQSELTNSSNAKTQEPQLEQYFVNEILPQHPDYQALIGEMNIVKVRQFSLYENSAQKTSSQQQAAWLVVASNSKQEHRIFLLGPSSQQELASAMSGSIGTEDKTCVLENTQFVGNSGSLVTDYKDASGYVVLSGSCPNSYGSGFFTSVFGLSDGKKIGLNGNNFTLPGQLWSGMSQIGTANGKLIGIYGYKQPQIVVLFGNLQETQDTDQITQVSHIGFFNLQTGKLEKLIPFQ